MISASFSKDKMNELRRFNWRNFQNEELKRGFARAVSLLGDSGISDPQKLFSWKKIKSDMNRLFATAKVSLNNTNVTLEPTISSIFQHNRNYDYVAKVWRQWRDASGKSFRKLYPDYINLSNEATKEYGFEDYGEFTRSSFEVDNLPEHLDQIYNKLESLYRLLHAFVKKNLGEMYPNKIDPKLGALPAHVLGDVWGQQWHNIFEDIKPFKNKTLLDITKNMIAKVNSFLCLFWWDLNFYF